ncbi:porin [Leucothrix mucor]|uniref:porin n=1 Tax=Leucothrix mucor TaxID=45248 RepID=UPI0003B6C110|nr:porin [Leucothrix mucor]
MKFKTLAIAIAAATVSTAAMADGHMGAPELKISGDVTVGLFQDSTGDSSFGGNGSEVIFNAEQKVGGVTYFGSMTANVADSQIGGGNISTDDLYVGFKGAFGEVRMGDTDNGCDAVDTGWVVDDEFISHNSGGCAAGDQNNITYKGSRGPVTYAIGYSPDVGSGDGATVAGENTVSLGIVGKIGPAAVSLGHEVAGDDSNTVLGVSGNFGPVAVGIRASKFEDNDTDVGYTAQYSARGNKFYIGYGDVNDDANTLFLGYQRSIGSNTTFITEYVNTDMSGVDDQYAIALKHAF